MLKQVKEMGSGGELAPPRVARLRFLLERTQKSLMEKSATAHGVDQERASTDWSTRSKPKSSRSSRSPCPASDEPDLQTYLAYADHLKLRRQRDRCLEVVDQALKSPQASRRTGAQIVMTLHVIAVEMALSTEDDKGRFDKADPHIRALLDRPEPKAQAFGHLFAGSIDLDRSNNAREGNVRAIAVRPPKDAATRLRVKRGQTPEDRRDVTARYRRSPGALRRCPGVGRRAKPGTAVPANRLCGSAASILNFSSGRRGPSSRPAIPRRPSRSSSATLARRRRGQRLARAGSGPLPLERRNPPVATDPRRS